MANVQQQVQASKGPDVQKGKKDNHAELQKRANRANQLVLFFLAGANFWEKRAKNCAIMSLFWEKHAKNCAIMSLFWC